MALLCGAEKKTKLLLALSICLTCCKTLCSGSLCSGRGGMCLCLFIDHKYLFCAGFRYSLSSEDPQSSFQTWHLFSHVEDLCACKVCCRSQLSFGVNVLSLVSHRQGRFEFCLGVQKERCTELV